MMMKMVMMILLARACVAHCLRCGGLCVSATCRDRSRMEKTIALCTGGLQHTKYSRYRQRRGMVGVREMNCAGVAGYAMRLACVPGTTRSSSCCSFRLNSVGRRATNCRQNSWTKVQELSLTDSEVSVDSLYPVDTWKKFAGIRPEGGMVAAP